MLNCTRGIIVTGLGLLAPLSLAADRPAYSQPAQPAQPVPAAQPQRPGPAAQPQRPAAGQQPMQQAPVAVGAPATQPTVQHEKLIRSLVVTRVKRENRGLFQEKLRVVGRLE